MRQIHNLLLMFFSLSQAVDRALYHIPPSRCKLRLCGDADRSAPPVGRLQGVGPKQRGVVPRGGSPRVLEHPGAATLA